MSADTQDAKPFEVRIEGDKVYLRVSAPEAGGVKVGMGDVQRELNALGASYRPETLFALVRRARNQFEPVGTRELLAYEIAVQVAEDGQAATMTVIAPTSGGAVATPAMFKDAIAAARVEKGLLFDEVRRIMTQREAREPVLIARGQQSVNGRNGSVTFLRPEAATPDPAGVEPVDHRERNLLRNVKEGETVAWITLPTRGKDGFTVTGRVLRARPGRRASIRLGRNVAYNDARTEALATRAGFVALKGSLVSVEDCYEVAEVNSATGNIRFNGVVRVRGGVNDTFTVEASRGIQVSGAVGQAVLKSEGDVEIQGGAMGATIEAGGTVSARFFSECALQAGQDILAEEYILHCQAQAGRAIYVTSEPDGFICGGVVRANNEISAPVLGSQVSEEKTHLEVGTGVDVRAQFERLRPQLEKDWETFDGLRKNLAYMQEQRLSEGALAPDRQAQMQGGIAAAAAARAALWDGVQKYHELQKGMSGAGAAARAVVLASNLANAGVNIQIQRMPMQLTTPLKCCGFVVLDGVLKVHDYEQVDRMVRKHRDRK
jgi:hypothetical protein